eukprot:scaffold151769_cov18-Tisochrysis_lutea.AAC.1
MTVMEETDGGVRKQAPAVSQDPQHARAGRRQPAPVWHLHVLGGGAASAACASPRALQQLQSPLPPVPHRRTSMLLYFVAVSFFPAALPSECDLSHFAIDAAASSFSKMHALHTR